MTQPNTYTQTTSTSTSTSVSPSTESPIHICLATCDSHIYWLQGRNFTRKFIPDHIDSRPIRGDVAFNDVLGGAGKTHLCLIVHHRESKKRHPKTCIYDVGSPIIQTLAKKRGNVFNSLYWPRCDGTMKNAFDEVLELETPSRSLGGMDDVRVMLTQTKPTVRLRDVIEPNMDSVSENDLAKYEKWKDVFVQRFM